MINIYKIKKSILLLTSVILLFNPASAQEIFYLNNTNKQITWKVKAQADLGASLLYTTDAADEL